MAAKPNVDLAEFFKLSKPKKAPCRIGHAMTLLKPAEREQLAAACETNAGIITNTAVQEWLAARKHDVSIQVVLSHRKRTCTCHDE